MRIRIGLVSVLLAVLVGCAVLTPEQREKADAARAAYAQAGQKLASLEVVVQAHIAEYEAIKAQVDSGQSIPAAVASRYAELTDLLKGDLVAWRDLKTAYDAARKASEEADAAGVPWHAKIPWGMIGTLLLGAAGTYFPVARPATIAAQAVIRGVASFTQEHKELLVDERGEKKAIGKVLKDTVLAAARDLGIESKLDALVQKHDPPRY